MPQTSTSDQVFTACHDVFNSDSANWLGTEFIIQEARSARIKLAGSELLAILEDLATQR
jgi:hypothetical protein